MATSTTTQQHGPDVHAAPRAHIISVAIERVIIWIGSASSLVIHTLAFIVAFAISILGVAEWSSMLLVLTTVVSLEAIYLAIFIQFSVNRQAASLKGVEQDVESIQEDLGEITENTADEHLKKKQAEMLEALTNDVKAMLLHLESLKAGR